MSNNRKPKPAKPTEPVKVAEVWEQPDGEGYTLNTFGVINYINFAALMGELCARLAAEQAVRAIASQQAGGIQVPQIVLPPGAKLRQ